MAAVTRSSGFPQLGGVGLRLGLTGKLGCVWVGVWCLVVWGGVVMMCGGSG